VRIGRIHIREIVIECKEDRTALVKIGVRGDEKRRCRMIAMAMAAKRLGWDQIASKNYTKFECGKSIFPRERGAYYLQPRRHDG